jgi:multicomponent Na+:H+ antiporter subunit B
MVTAVLADYRGFDTLFETCVLFLSGLVVLTLLRQDSPRQGIGQEKAAPERLGEAGAGGKTLAKNKTSSSFGGMVLDASFRAIVPIIMIYGIYVLAHGEVSLGGGFQAGALLACAYLIDRIIPSMDNRIGRIKPENAIILAGGGTFLYALTGMLPMATGGNFLEFDKLPLGGWIGQGTVHLHSLGILLIEIGVTICVMAVITNILEIVMERTHFDD